MSTYFSAPPAVVDGDIAYAADVNGISVAVDAAFSTVESAISGLPATVQFWATKAENWATKAEDSVVESGKYSALHHAAKASASATSASGSAGTAVASAGSATSSASSASISSGTATTQAGIATTQAGIATTQATLATKYAQEAENTEVEAGTYSAYHWSKKSQAYAATSVATVTGTGVNNTDPRNPVISISASTISLGNVNNTSDANKPVSSAQQSALDLKANLASPTFTGTPAGPTATVGTNTTQLATTAFVLANTPDASVKLFHVQDQKSSGTGGGTSTSGTQTRVLNTILTNEIGASASLSSNQVTLPAGDYFINASATYYGSGGAGGTKLRLYSITGSVYILEGLSLFTLSSGGLVVTLCGKITLADETVIELRHYVGVGEVNGLGVAISQGTEVYANLEVWKLT